MNPLVFVVKFESRARCPLLEAPLPVFTTQIIPDKAPNVSYFFRWFYVLLDIYFLPITTRRRPSTTSTLNLTPVLNTTLVQAKARPERGFAARSGQSEKNVRTTTKIYCYASFARVAMAASNNHFKFLPGAVMDNAREAAFADENEWNQVYSIAQGPSRRNFPRLVKHAGTPQDCPG